MESVQPASPPGKLHHDFAMAKQFLTALDPQADMFTFQLFSDGRGGPAQVIHDRIEDFWPNLQALNTPDRQIGVFVTVNTTDFKGRRRENIVQARALFVDADGKDQVERCIDEIKASGATPSIMVRSSADSAHFYWICDDLEIPQFSSLQRALIDKLGTDPAVKDLPRVMRLPGTLHLKDRANPRLVELRRGRVRRWETRELVELLSLTISDSRPRRNGNFQDSSLPGENTTINGQGLKLEKIRSAVVEIRPTEIATEHGWMRLARGLAHTAFVHSQHAHELWAILDQASKHAPNYNAEDNLERWNRYIREAPTCQEPITIATVFRMARDAGWPGCNPSTCDDGNTNPDEPGVLYAPGNEEACRRAIDRVVADDERAFTLEGSGLLAILRVPETEDQAPGVKWDGDLPGTTLATTPDIMERAERLKWMRTTRTGESRIYPPRGFVADYITQMRGRYSARKLRGIARVPRIDEDGKINFSAGYDPETRLYHDQIPTFDVPPSPSRDDVSKAREALLLPFSEYQFESEGERNPLLLGAIFTALERPYLPTAPMLVIRSSMPGTGKGLLVRSLTQLAYDTYPVVATWGATSEETEKRIGALLLQSPAAINIDNANGKMIYGELLESIITEGRADIRILGRSEMAKVHNRSLLMLTGNNPQITGDMARRCLALNIKPRSADPESDSYRIKPVEAIQRHRPRFLRAAFTIMRAYRQTGIGSCGLPSVGSFDDWSRRVRDLVYWLTDYDLADEFKQNKTEDPRRQDDAALMADLYDLYGAFQFRAKDVVQAFNDVITAKRQSISTDPKKEALHAALEAVLGSGKVSSKQFGYWARRVNRAYTGEFKLHLKLDKSTNTNVITISRV